MRSSAIVSWRGQKAVGLLGMVVAWLALPASPGAAPVTVVPKWSRFETAFKSGILYSNPLQEACLTVTFASPLGETSQVYGFWDGGRTWRVRFAPDMPGRWTFKTACSDAANRDLDGRTGEFLCSAPVGENRFDRHGPVQLSRDHRYLVHSDGTPFFWLADTVWNGARMAQPKDWEVYAQVRASQHFAVAQWSVAPGGDVRNQSALTGFPERIGVNPEFFKRLESKLATLSDNGILSAISPLSELEATPAATALPDDQAVLVVRYVVARFGAEPVAWLMAFDGDTQGKRALRWKKIGREVFAGIRHAPVLLYPGKSTWLMDDFQDQPWVDAFCFQPVANLSDDALKWTFSGPFADAWTRPPARPLIPVTPIENALAPGSRQRFTADNVRRAAW